MKTKIFIILACLGMLMGCRCGNYPTSNYSSTGCNQGYCSSANPSPYTSHCGMSDAERCACVDPGCRGSNYCLSRCRCCKYFGNIGALDYPGASCEEDCDP